MASCKIGHIYIVETALTRPPKAKFAICICVDPHYFLWINTKAAPHGRDQLLVVAGCHQLIRHDSHIDLSRIVTHPTWELEGAAEFACIDRSLAQAIIAAIDSGLVVMSPRHADIVRQGLARLYP